MTMCNVKETACSALWSVAMSLSLLFWFYSPQHQCDHCRAKLTSNWPTDLSQQVI